MMCNEWSRNGERDRNQSRERYWLMSIDKRLNIQLEKFSGWSRNRARNEAADDWTLAFSLRSLLTVSFLAISSYNDESNMDSALNCPTVLSFFHEVWELTSTYDLPVLSSVSHGFTFFCSRTALGREKFHRCLFHDVLPQKAHCIYL